MSLVVPDSREAEVLANLLNTPLTLRLYSNDRTPAGGDVVANYTEIIGGGYVNKPLLYAHWDITEGDPTVAIYDTVQSWVFTGATSGPGTIYGYYITRDSDGLLMWAERLPSGSVPFSSINGSVIRITPRITCA